MRGRKSTRPEEKVRRGHKVGPETTLSWRQRDKKRLHQTSRVVVCRRGEGRAVELCIGLPQLHIAPSRNPKPSHISLAIEGAGRACG